VPWFNVDDGFAFHRKAVRAGNSALGLWVRAGSWCAQQLTDGFVPSDMVPTMGTVSQAERLVAAGLWSEVDGGYMFHEWTDSGRNPSRSEVLLRRKKEAEKKAKARAAKSAPPQANSDSPPRTQSGLPGVVPGGVGATTPLPSTPSKEDSLRSSSPRKRGSRIPDDFTVTADMVAWAREHAPNVDGRRATDSFIDYWRGRTGRDATKADWPATWRNWMRREQERADRSRPQSKANTTDANIHALLNPNASTPALRALPGGAS
jgi:hypothetical protein